MKGWFLIACVLLVACGRSPEHVAYSAIRAGNADYSAHHYADAAIAYSTVPDDQRAKLGLGNSHFRLGQLPEGAAAFAETESMAPEQATKAQAFYNLGTTQALTALLADSLSKAALNTLGGIKIEGNDIGQKVSLIVLRDSLLRERHRLEILTDSTLLVAQNALKNALRRAPEDDNARYNLMSVKHSIAIRLAAEEERRKQNEKDKKNQPGTKLSAMALRLVQRADSLVDKYRFNEALNVLESGLKKDPSLKKEEEYMKKLGTVTEAAKAQ